MENKSFVELVKDKNDIVDVAQELIPSLCQSGHLWIGSVRDERTPALTIYPESQSYYHFAGDTTPDGQNGGDVIVLVQFVKSCDFKEALKFLADRADVRYTPLSIKEEEELEGGKKKSQLKAQMLEKMIKIFEKNQDSAVTYLAGRGIKPEVVNKYRIGWSNSILELQTIRKEYEDSVALEAFSNPLFFEDSLIIPIVERGKVISLYSRSETRKAKHMFLPGCPKGIFNYDECLKSADKEVFLAEAPIDALSAINHGITNIIAFGGCMVANEQKQVLIKLYEKEVNLIVLFDNDLGADVNRGYEAAKSLMSEFPKAVIKLLPPGDLNDFFKTRTLQDFQRLEDRNYFELLLEEIPKGTSKDKVITHLKPLLVALSGADNAEAEIFIRNKVKEYFSLNTPDSLSIVKKFKEVKKEFELKKLEASLKKGKSEIAKEKKLTKEEIAEAENILKSPKLLKDVIEMVKRLGVVGEEKNILIIYNGITSRLLQKPLSIVVKGDSSAGKSHTSNTTIKLFPKSAYVDITDATPQSFYYVGDDYFKHRIIVIFERHGSEKADYAIRSLQSEGKLKIQVTVKDPDTGSFVTQEIEKEGPTGFITTTTSASIHSENETRNISIFPDQSIEQTKRVYGAIEARYLGKKIPTESELKPWQNAQLLLESLPVNISFVASLNKYFPSDILRTRRDYGHFLAHIEVSAFLHQKQRPRIEIGGQTYIRATLADYHIASTIAGESLSKSIYELAPRTIELIELAHQISNDNSDEMGNPLPFSITELAQKIGWDRDTVAKWLKPSVKKGYVTVVNEARGSQGATYKIEKKDLPGNNFLPPVEELFNQNPNEPIENIYNPLTGEIVTIFSEPKVSTDEPMMKTDQ